MIRKFLILNLNKKIKSNGVLDKTLPINYHINCDYDNHYQFIIIINQLNVVQPMITHIITKEGSHQQNLA